MPTLLITGANRGIGLTSMMYQLDSGQIIPEGKPKNLETTRYALGLLQLEKKSSNNPEVFQKLLAGIKDTQLFL